MLRLEDFVWVDVAVGQGITVRTLSSFAQQLGAERDGGTML